MGRVEPEDDEEQQTARTAQAASGGRRENRRNGNRVSAAVKTAAPAPETPAKESIRDADFIKRGLEQMGGQPGEEAGK